MLRTTACSKWSTVTGTCINTSSHLVFKPGSCISTSSHLFLKPSTPYSSAQRDKKCDAAAFKRTSLRG
eukprot:3481986-Amphidinium_carterae.1